MSAHRFSSSRVIPGAAVTALALALPCSGLGVTPKTDAFPTSESYIKISGQAASITGDEAAFSKRTQQPPNGGAGIEDLHIVKDLSKTTAVVVDARTLAGPEDYLLRANLTKTDVGSVDVGYKRFRTFYDGIGGFFPLNQAWLPLSTEDLHTDRGRFWAAVKLEQPEKPVLELRYTNETRSGRKDSLTWGDSNLTGLPTLPANNATRKIVPAYLELGERHQVLEGSVRHTVGKTTAMLRVAGDWVSNLDTRYVTRYPGEVLPNPERRVYQKDGLETNGFSIIGTTETVFTEKITFNTGLSYQSVSGAVSGERPNAIGVLPTFDFKDLAGTSKATVYTGNVSLRFQPTPVWVIQPSLRGEDSYTKSLGTFNRITTAGTSPVAVTTLFKENSRVKDQIVTPDLAVRYTGFNRWVLYGSVSDRIDRGDDRHTDQFSTPFPTGAQLQTDDVDQNQAHYTVGANWNMSAKVVLRAEVFHKDHENKFLGYATQLGSRFVLGYQFTGLKFTAIVKPIPQLSFTTRYQPQKGEMQVTTDSTARFDSMAAKSQMIAETIDWNPNRAIYVQAAVNLVFNQISTAYPRDQAPLTIAPQRNSDNNFWTTSVMSGFVVDKRTDAQLQFTYQRADNFEPGIATGTQPYGAGYEEYTATAGLKHKFGDRWMGSGKLGYFSSKNDTTGGKTNFHGPLAYVSIEYSL